MSLLNPDPRDFDRRQSARIRCGGLANIFTLPFEGLSVPGRVLNLSLGGCGIESALPLPGGTRAEIVLKVNSASIRVVGEVQTSRSPLVMGVEFLLLSAFGKQLLAELIQELATQQATASIGNAARRQFEIESLQFGRPILRNENRSMQGNLVNLWRGEPNVISIERPVSAAAPTRKSTILNGDEIDLFI